MALAEQQDGPFERAAACRWPRLPEWDRPLRESEPVQGLKKSGQATHGSLTGEQLASEKTTGRELGPRAERQGRAGRETREWPSQSRF